MNTTALTLIKEKNLVQTHHIIHEYMTTAPRYVVAVYIFCVRASAFNILFVLLQALFLSPPFCARYYCW